MIHVLSVSQLSKSNYTLLDKIYHQQWEFACSVSVSSQFPLPGLPLTHHCVTCIHILLLEYSEWIHKEFPHEHKKCSYVNVTSDLRQYFLKVFTAMTHLWSFFKVTIVFCSAFAAKPLKYRIWEQICLHHSVPGIILGVSLTLSACLLPLSCNVSII